MPSPLGSRGSAFILKRIGPIDSFARFCRFCRQCRTVGMRHIRTLRQRPRPTEFTRFSFSERRTGVQSRRTKRALRTSKPPFGLPFIGLVRSLLVGRVAEEQMSTSAIDNSAAVQSMLLP